MLVTEPIPAIFDGVYSVLGKSKKSFIPDRFSPISRKQTAIGSKFSLGCSFINIRMYLPNSC